MAKVAIILGSGLYDLYAKESKEETTIQTKYGPATISSVGSIGGAEAFVLLRHGPNYFLPPHLINYRANITALKDFGINYTIATASVGAINRELKIGSFVVVDQFIDQTKNRIGTFYVNPGEQFAFTDMTHPYSEEVRQALIRGLVKNKVRAFARKGTYLCTEGPRFETPAEIKMFRKMGADVVGMTGVPEVVLAREIHLSYATICYVTNLAAGMQNKVSQDEVTVQVERNLAKTKTVISTAIEELLR
ncbi:MAG: S-methyl-5'-thioinosine phosphorylase [Nitrososphaerales archaeon]